VDVAAFEGLIAAGTPGALERAAESCRGDLLLGFTLDEPLFDRACCRRATESARAKASSAPAASTELRAATGLARLWGAQGKPGPARELLAPIHDWFTEGLDLDDPREAQALLEQLGREAGS